MPLAVVVDGAHRTDLKVAEATWDGIMVERPTPTPAQPQPGGVDAGSDDEAVEETVRAHHDQPPIRPKQPQRSPVDPSAAPEPQEEPANSLEPTTQPRRWVVERLHAWLTRSRRLLVRWEKLGCTYEAFLHVACALICFQHCDRFRSFQVSA